MNRERHDPGFLLGETLALMRGNLALVATAFAVMTAADVGSDLLASNGAAMNLLTLPLTLAFQYEIARVALSQKGLAERRGRRRFWALLGVNILFGLGVAVGLLLLIVPGLYLYVRWSVAVPVLIAEDAGPAEALSRSGEEISGRFWPVAGLFLLTALPSLAGLAGAVIVPNTASLLSSLVLNVPVNLALIAGWYAAVAVYADGKGGERLAQVFA